MTFSTCQWIRKIVPMWATPSSTLSHLRPSLGSVAFFLGRDFYVQQIALCSFQGWHVQFVGFQLDCFFWGVLDI